GCRPEAIRHPSADPGDREPPSPGVTRTRQTRYDTVTVTGRAPVVRRLVRSSSPGPPSIGFAGIGRRRRSGDADLPLAARRRVGAGAALAGVGARAAVVGIVAVAALQGVVARAATEGVVAALALDGVVAGAAGEGVRAGAAEGPVVAVAQGDGVGT